uniref:Acetyltransferase (GNAT) family protein n=1 Tax=Candidatus Kentrum sp. DK TaxID=2126562 RepID=A0A450RYE3_9GAMM|nr:MAG: Acetyltransferase (GNAT) family protein [Candidatus Kentron sp. DK]
MALTVEKLAAIHNVSRFDCGEKELNRFLARFALSAQRANSSQTYVACGGDHDSPGRMKKEIFGYYTLAAASAEHGHVPARVVKGLARHRVPLMLIARLAVGQREQGCGIGRGLLKDALLRTVNAAEIAGIRAVVVHAKSERARSWYEAFDFEASPTDPYHLFLLMKDIKASMRGNGAPQYS